MKVNVIERDEKMMKFEIEGEGHTFLNALRKQLWTNPNVLDATYIMRNSFVGNPIFKLKLKKGSPQDALKNAAKQILNDTKELQKHFERNMKG